jgi:hypothetical protein
MSTVVQNIFAFSHLNLLRNTVQNCPGEQYKRTSDPGWGYAEGRIKRYRNPLTMSTDYASRIFVRPPLMRQWRRASAPCVMVCISVLLQRM